MPVNLHQKFNHYLHTPKKLDLQDIDERVIGYGWTDDGKDLTGYYVQTETHRMYFDLKERFKYKEVWEEAA
jgi:hypothetical protein